MLNANKIKFKICGPPLISSTFCHPICHTTHTTESQTQCSSYLPFGPRFVVTIVLEQLFVHLVGWGGRASFG